MKKLLCSVNLLVILALVLAGIFISGAAKPESQNSDVYVYDPNNPKTIAVEAYLAQIPDEALIEIGLPLIPTKESEAITVDKLLKCLTSTKVKGMVISSGRWVTIEGRGCEIKQNNTFYLKREQISGNSNEGPVTSVTFEQYESRTSGNIGATSMLTKGNKIKLYIAFSYAGISPRNEEKAGNETPPDHMQYEFTNEVLINNDVPAIVSAVKQGNSVLYLVIRAKVLDE